MDRRIVFLRGINVGPANRVAMADLRELLQRLGYADVRTLGQSGNVVLSSDAPAEELEAAIEAGVGRLGVETRVVSRTAGELAAVVAGNPFAEVADDPRRHQVSFLSAEPDPEAVREIEAADLAPERVVFDGREVHAWHPDGIQRSPLARLLTDKRLGVTATARNWRTVTALLEPAASGGAPSSPQPPTGGGRGGSTARSPGRRRAG